MLGDGVQGALDTQQSLAVAPAMPRALLAAAKDRRAVAIGHCSSSADRAVPPAGRSSIDTASGVRGRLRDCERGDSDHASIAPTRSASLLAASGRASDHSDGPADASTRIASRQVSSDQIRALRRLESNASSCERPASFEHGRKRSRATRTDGAARAGAVQLASLTAPAARRASDASRKQQTRSTASRGLSENASRVRGRRHSRVSSPYHSPRAASTAW